MDFTSFKKGAAFVNGFNFPKSNFSLLNKRENALAPLLPLSAPNIFGVKRLLLSLIFRSLAGIIGIER